MKKQSGARYDEIIWAELTLGCIYIGVSVWITMVGWAGGFLF